MANHKILILTEAEFAGKSQKDLSRYSKLIICDGDYYRNHQNIREIYNNKLAIVCEDFGGKFAL